MRGYVCSAAGAVLASTILFLAAPAAFCAAVSSGNAAGYVRVTCGSGWTALGSPFAGADGAAARTVGELVETNSLPSGAQVVTYDDGDYSGYRYDGGKWQGMVTAKPDETISAGDPGADEVPRGRGFWLRRGGEGAGKVYVSGLVVAPTGSCAVVKGGGGLAEFTLAANGGYAPATLAELVESPSEGDRVSVPAGAATTDFVYTNGCWRVRVRKVVGSFGGMSVTRDVWEEAATNTIPPARGFWYIRERVSESEERQD